jgi:hypothetical protein
MTAQKFAVIVPRNDAYIHTHALDEVAETVHYGLRALGHESTLGIPNKDGPRIIFLGANLLGDILDTAPEDTIVYNIEQLDDNRAAYFATHFRPFTVWDYSERNIVFWKSQGITAVHVPIGYVPEMTRIISMPVQDIDVLFYGFPNERRIKIHKELVSRGLAAVWPTDCYGAARDAYISNSKVVLNMHFYAPGIFEIARVSYLLANKKCVVSESSIDIPYGFSFKSRLFNGIYFEDYKYLAMACQGLVDDVEQRKEQAENGFELFKKFDERDILKKALEASL